MSDYYKKVDFSNKLGKDEPQDNLGYLGKSQWYREAKPKQIPISEDDFIKIIMQSGKINSVFKIIYEIDKDHNGYVTRQELDDILKLVLKDTLNNRDLNPIINKFYSIQNKILIDYNQLRNWMEKEYNTRLKHTSTTDPVRQSKVEETKPVSEQAPKRLNTKLDPEIITEIKNIKKNIKIQKMKERQLTEKLNLQLSSIEHNVQFNRIRNA